MTNEQISAFLQAIHPAEKPFYVIQTGKKSKKVNGLYKQATAEILLHNRNFANPQDMLRTAIHEYAHHLHFTSATPPKPNRPHDSRFWALFHDLLAEAEKKGVFVDVFRTDPEFTQLTQSIRNDYLKPQAAFLRELGQLLGRAETLCRERSLSYRDYVERELGLRIPTARLALACHREELPDEITPDQARTLLRLPREERPILIEQLKQGKTEAQVVELSRPPSALAANAESRIEQLRKRKMRLQALVQKYSVEIQRIEEEIHQAEEAET